MEGTVWKQAALPIRHGGLGLRNLTNLALPCYISSLHKTQDLVKQLLPPLMQQIQTPLSTAKALLSIKYPNLEAPTGDSISQQKAWDDAVCSQEFNNLINSGHQVDSARLLAAASPHSGAWLHALPLPQLGLNLDNDTVRTAVALRIGSPICQEHKCRCGQRVDRLGHHGLGCLKSAGRWPRHAHINDVIKRSLATAGIPSILEPAGLNASNSIRPDGITVFPFSQGKSLCWDATVSDTFCKSSVIASAISPGSAANKAEERKNNHYQTLTDRYRFTPISLETTGVYGKDTEKFVTELGRRLKRTTGDPREAMWLRQRLSVAIVRGNAASILATGQFTT